MMPSSYGDSEKYCWPYLGIIANIANDPSNVHTEGQYSQYWTRKFSDFKPLKIGRFLNKNQQTEHVIVTFGSDWSGFKNAIDFEKSFEAREKGRNEWIQRKTSPGLRLYGWVACQDDYESDGPLGQYLRSNVALKALPELIMEANTSRVKTLCDLMNEVHTALSSTTTTTKMQCIAREHIAGVIEEREMLKFEMEHKRQRLDSRRKDLDEREGRILEVENLMTELRKSEKALVEREKQIVRIENIERDLTNRMLQMTVEERRKANENAQELREVQKREKQAVEKVFELERELGEKRGLEIEIEQLKDQMKGLKALSQDLLVNDRLRSDDCIKLINREKEAVEKVVELERELSEKRQLEKEIKELKDQMNDLTVKERQSNDELLRAVEKILGLERELDVKHSLEVEIEELKERMNDLQISYQEVIVKERQCNDELQGGRKELMRGLSGMRIGHRSKIGIKRMGEIDTKAFKKACNERFEPEDVEINALELCSFWQEKLKNPQWHPFRVVENNTGIHQRVLDEDDELLRGLKEEWGEEIYEAVVTALKEVHDYNPSGCYLVSEFWNLKENKKASLKEVIGHVCGQLKTLKRKRL